MSATDFDALYEQVTGKTGGWQEALRDAWPCLSEDQKNLLEAATG